MEKQPGDTYIRQLAGFIRDNGRGLAESGLARRRRHPRSDVLPPSLLNPLGWLSPGLSISPTYKPIILTTDTHHLFYTLIRLEALGFDVGHLDIRVESPSRPMSYTSIYPERKDPETLSLASFRSSLSIVSSMSLGGGWWPAYDSRGIENELRYIYSSFTKLPGLSISAPGQKVITELVNDSPDQNAIPLDAFKNLERLECENIDPRILLGWDRLAESLKSLKIIKSGLDDISEIIVGAVLNDQARRQKSPILPNQHTNSALDPQGSSSPPTSLDTDNLDSQPNSRGVPPYLSSQKWALLKHLYLPENGLTFFPSDMLPYLTPLTHLDLSSNLFVSVPSGLGELYNLLSLNLAGNLIDSVLGIFLNLGQILSLNLSHNRLDSLCGLERLLALERIDLRNNLLEESSEISRLAPMPNLSELWVEGNPFVEIEEGYRVACFDYFWREGKEISLDGARPNLYERRNLNFPDQVPPLLMQGTSSAPIIPIEHARAPLIPSSQQRDLGASGSFPALSPPSSTPTGGMSQRRKKLTRIVDLEGSHSDQGSQSVSHSRGGSVDGPRVKRTIQTATVRLLYDQDPKTTGFSEHHEYIPQLATIETHASDKQDTANEIPSLRPHHTRHQTDYSLQSSVLPPIPSDPLSTRKVRAGSTISKSERRRTSASFEHHSSTSSGSNVFVDDNIDNYRKRIESLKQDMGDSWLKVYTNQNHSS